MSLKECFCIEQKRKKKENKFSQIPSNLFVKLIEEDKHNLSPLDLTSVV